MIDEILNLGHLERNSLLLIDLVVLVVHIIEIGIRIFCQIVVYGICLLVFL